MSRPLAVPTIVSINIFVFLLWSIFGESSFMTQNFLVSWNAISEGRIWTLITSEFSHYMFLHILINMYVFYGFGTMLELTLGTKRFVRFYLIAAVVASVTHSAVSAILLGEPQLEALGASGAVSGVIMLFSLLYPRQKILIFGLIPVPAIWGAIFAVGLDMWGLIAQTTGVQSPIGHGAHLGGALAGLIYFLQLRKR